MAGLNEYDSLATDLFKSNKPTSDLVEPPRQNSEPNAEYNELAAQTAQVERQKLQQSLYVADKKDPTREAEIVKISKKLNMPMDIVDRNFDSLKKQAEPATDYDAIIKDTPNLAKWLKDPVNATMGKDDLDKLGVIDAASGKLKSNTKKEGYFNLIPSASESKQALTTGYNDLSASAGHLAVVFGKMKPDEAVDFIAESNRKSRELRAQVPNYVTEFNNKVEQIDVDSGWQQFLSGFEASKQGRIKDALIAYGQGGGRTVADTLELIGSSVVRPRALIYTAMQSLAHSAPSLITGWAGAKVGAATALIGGQLGPQAALPEELVTVPIASAIGFGVGSFAGSAPTEVGSWINQAMQERGVDITSPDSLRDAYSDAKLMADIKAEAIRKGVTTAAVDGLFSAFAGKFLKGAAPDASLATRFAAGAKELGVQASGESLSEGAGQFAARGELGQVSLSEVLQEGITSFGHTAGELVVQAPGQVKQLSADTLQAVRSRFSQDPVKAAEQVVGQVETAMEAQSDTRELQALGEAVRDSKTAGRMPEAIKNLIDTAAEGGESSNVYFQADDWDNHWNRKGQSPSEAAANIMGDDGEAYFRAKAEGTQFAVPMSDYVSKTASKENFADFEALMPFARVRADGMSLAESQEILSALPSLMDQLAQESVANPEVPNAADPALNVQNQVNDRLMEIGFDETTADQYAQVYGSAFRALAERTGLNADELFSRYGLQISRLDTQRDGESAAQYDQRANDPVRQEFVEFLNSKGKAVVRGQLIMPYMLREAGAPQEMIDRLVEYNKPENDPAEKMLEVYRRKRFNQDAESNQASASLTESESKFFSMIFNNPSELSELHEVVPSAKFADGVLSMNSDDATLEAFDQYIDNMRINRESGMDRLPPSFFATTKDSIYSRLYGSRKDNAFNQGGQDPRGQITFGNANVNIDLLPKANLSTFLHETGHFMLEVMGDIAQSPDAPESIRQDYDTLLKFFEVDSRDQIETKHHEQFARSFEAYLMEGKAPSQGLRKAFSKFRSWLTAIYRTIRNLNVELTPEVRGVFDRMLATDQELAEAGASANLQPMFTDPAQSGMNETQAAQYAETIEEARQAAETELQTKLMADIVRERKAFYKEEKAKVRAEVEAQINSNPVYIAASVLQRGKMPDGSEPADGLKGIKLDRDALIQQYGKDFLKKLPRPYMYAKDGLNPNLVAEMFGFKSGDEMITNIMNSPKRDSLINLQSDAIMKDRHGDLLNDPSLPDEAMKAVHNEKRSLLLRKEIEYLASEEFATFKGLTKRISRRMPSVEAVRQQAERTVAGMKVRNISPVVYQRAETKASRDAMDAFLRGDFNAAFEAKQRELLNNELYRATVSAREQTDKVVDYMKRFTKTETRKRLGKAGEAYLGQIDSLMERFEFVRGVSLSAIDKRESLVKWVEEQRAQGIEPLIPEKVMNEAYRISYKEMTMDELNGIYDAARNIAHLAKVKNELLANQRQRDLQAAREEAIASINGNSKGLRPVQIETRRKELELRRLGAGFLAEHRKLSNILREMDGWQDGGSMWDLVMRPLNDAANRETEMNAIATKAFQSLFSAYTVKDRSRFWKEQFHLSPKTFFPSLKTERFDGNVTKEGMLMIALNWGNLDNRAKLLDGMGWNEGQVQEVFAQLDERDWTFVQGVWDLIDSYWAETKGVAQRVDGIAPGKVEASGFEVRTSDGKNMAIKGGYFPLKYDSRRAPQAFANEAADKAKATMAGSAVRATTAHGHRKERVQGVQMPVRLDFGVMTEHVQQVIHDITHYETIIDMNRLIGSKDIQDAIISNYGDIIYGEVRDAITDVAAGQETARTSVEKALSYIRTGMTFASMGWNLNTVLQQPLGLTQSVFRVGPKWVALGVSKFLGNPTKMTATIDMVYGKSSFMKHRGETQNREINEIRNGVNKSEWKSDLEASFLYLIQKGQLIADMPTWLGAYEKAMADMPQAESREAADAQESQAVALADQAVIDSQSGGHIKDLAKIQRKGPIWKVWTAFYSYFSATYNLNYEAVSRTDFRRAQDVGRLAVDLLTINVMPSTLSTLLYLSLKGDLPEDGEEWAKTLAQANASYLLGNMIGLRELGGAVSGFNGYEGPAGARFFSDATKLIKNAQDGEMDEQTWRALNKTAGILFQYPSGQLDRTWRGLNAWLDGETKNPMAVIMGPPQK